MIAQVRSYAINNGTMDQRVSLFSERLAPIHALYGINIVGAWVNRPQNEFVWIRTFENEEDKQTKTKAYNSSSERRALGAHPGSHHAKLEVREVDHVFDPQPLVVSS